MAREAKPGQFVMVQCGGECVLPRPFSIHQINNEGLALFFAVLEHGKGTTWLSQQKVGDVVELLGPLGKGYSINPGAQNLLLLAGGNGIAPLHFIAQEALNQKRSATLIYGTADANRYPEHLLPAGIELVGTTEDGTIGRKGVVTDLLPKYIDEADQIFACGPVGMYRTMAQIPEFKNKPVQVSLEVRMGCGVGACYGCTVKTKSGLKQVCKDGPVFDLEDILWNEVIC